MLHPNDFRTIWELAHLWAGAAPDKTDPQNLSDVVFDKLQKLIWAFLRAKIGLRRKSGYKVDQEDWYILVFNLNRTRVRLVRAVTSRQFERKFLDSLFVMRSEVLKLCADEFIAPPGIWAADMVLPNGEDAPKPINGRHRDDEVNKQLCQGIALTLWDIDPQIHPAHMAKHHAILMYGNGRLYKGDDTVRGWINEVDPQKIVRKTGRPPIVRHLLDIEKGGLSSDYVHTLMDQADAA